MSSNNTSPTKLFYQVSHCIREAFPHTESKLCCKSRQKHLLGLEWICTPEPSITGSSEPAASTSDLRMQIQQLQCRVAELESRSEAVLCSQADNITQHKSVNVTEKHITNTSKFLLEAAKKCD